MAIFLLIVSLAAHFFTAYCCIYSSYRIKLYQNDKEIFTRHPSITDLKSTDNEYLTNKYIEEVICPASNYFILKNKIKNLQTEDAGESLIYIVLQFFSFFILITKTISVFPNNGLQMFWYLFIIIGTNLIICSLGSFILYKIHNKFYSNYHFYSTEEKLKERFKYENTDFNITENDAFNNFVIFRHYEYLKLVEDSIQFRNYVRKIIIGVFSIFYLLVLFLNNFNG